MGPRRSGYGRQKESGGKVTSGTTQTEGSPSSSNNQNNQTQSPSPSLSLSSSPFCLHPLLPFNSFQILCLPFSSPLSSPPLPFYSIPSSPFLFFTQIFLPLLLYSPILFSLPCSSSLSSSLSSSQFPLISSYPLPPPSQFSFLFPSSS